jgi:peptidoglycan/xylan/chitin deacetylase (PgdA/CDA1 family)
MRRKGGGVILIHDIYDNTAEVVQLLMPKRIDTGYQLVTNSELFESKGASLIPGRYIIID